MTDYGTLTLRTQEEQAAALSQKAPVVTRPATEYDDPSHTYTLDGEELLGVSTVAKIGGAEETWGIASAWGFRIGYEGAYDCIEGIGPAEEQVFIRDKEHLREELKRRGLTPWSVRDKAADRGSWVHDILERLGQEGEVVTAGFLDSFSEEYRGHVRAVLAWFLDYRPVFVATEVQVTSAEHGFAGRYDIRCLISEERLLERLGELTIEYRDVGDILCLVDLKTSKDVYPTTHFPQLAGYELASVEMGFPPTQAQFVLQTNSDGTYQFKQSWSEPEDFLAYLGALKAIRRIEANDPLVKLRVAREEAILVNLPGRSAAMAARVPELAGMDGKGVGILMSGLRKRGLVEQRSDKTWELVVPTG